MITRKFLLILYLISPLTLADTYGYLGFWHHPNQPHTIPQTKTTRENNNQQQADAEINQFCEQHDQQLTEQSGCFHITPLHNTCAAVAWSRKRGLISPDNIVISILPDFSKVAKLASKSCRQQYGWFARCEVETVYCTDSTMYQ